VDIILPAPKQSHLGYTYYVGALYAPNNIYNMYRKK